MNQNPLVSNLKSFHLQMGSHSRSAFAVLLFGLFVVAVLAYTYYRDWRLRKGFRQYWKANANPGSSGSLAAVEMAGREPIIKSRKAGTGAAAANAVVQKPAMDAQRLGSSLSGVQNLASSAAAPALPEKKLTRAGSLSRRGLVTVHSKQNPADIFVDGVFRGCTPAQLALEEGPHVVLLKHPGCQEYRRELVVTAGSEHALRAVLEKGTEEAAI